MTLVSSVVEADRRSELGDKVLRESGRCVERYSPMEFDAPTKAKIAVLTAEIDMIHFTNALYWKRGQSVSTEERAEYERRNARLEEIRTELSQLGSRM
jgi:hypothetical protein